jgi:microcystin-dependent protein
MAQPFVGEIRMFAGNFAPAGWMFCEGQLLPISENEVLFQLIGTTYGGDGQSTFALPDLRGRLPVHQGQGPGLSNRILAETFGVESVTLTANQIPVHTHALSASNALGDSNGPGGKVPARSTNIDLYSGDPPDMNMAAASIASAGGSQPHDNFQPFLCVNFIISLFGIFPSQS